MKMGTKENGSAYQSLNLSPLPVSVLLNQGGIDIFSSSLVDLGPGFLSVLLGTGVLGTLGNLIFQ